MLVEIKQMTAREAVKHIQSTRKLTELEETELRYCAQWTTMVWGGYIDGVLVGAWGLAPMTLLADTAYLWLYSNLREHQLTFIRHSKRMVEDMLQIYPHIVGVTQPSDLKAQRWLQWLGAQYVGTNDFGLLKFVIDRRKEPWTQSA